MAPLNSTSKTEDGPNLAACIEAIAENKSRDAFSQLFSHMAPRIKAYCLKRGASPAAAEETAQETMIQVWRRAGQYDPARASATTWIFTIARNKRIDLFRKEQHPEVTPDDLLQSMSDPIDAENRMEQAQAGETLAKKIRELSPDQAEVIHKAFFEDKTHQVISEELAVPLGTVKSRIRLALAKLRSSMAEYEG
ncbi:MAG: sigma-70 family RNA polymerase sigma factor [Alphaproteobacteria bacterium]|nr:sigma-70 family RNA polymerase sigma factor [Alphaproteobacteria bacterium]